MEYSDEILESKIEDLKSKIRNWAISKDLWTDSMFTTYLDHFEDEPSDFPVILVLCSDGGMTDIFSYEDYENTEEFIDLIDETEFYYELNDNCTALFYTTNDDLIKPYYEYFEWKWVCRLLEPDYTELYDEVFNVISNNPSKLHKLGHRQFEIFIHELFKNQGYETELGAGTGDGGVDVKVYKKDEIDQIVTLIQVKKYKESNPIKLEAVAALNAHVNDQNANRGLFITTSRFLPGVKDFANRQNKKLILANKSHIQNWSKLSATKIIRDKSILISDHFLLNLIKQKGRIDLVGRIVHANTGYNIITNDFCLILKETKNAVLLIRLKSKVVKLHDPPYIFRGTETPLLDQSVLENRNKENVFRAKKSINERKEYYFWGQQNLYSLWNGESKNFDLLD